MVAIVSAKFLQNQHKRTFVTLQATGYLSGRLSLSRFNRRLRALADWVPPIAETLGLICAMGKCL